MKFSGLAKKATWSSMSEGTPMRCDAMHELEAFLMGWDGVSVVTCFDKRMVAPRGYRGLASLVVHC